jgi:hypothetical protein
MEKPVKLFPQPREIPASDEAELEIGSGIRPSAGKSGKTGQTLSQGTGQTVVVQQLHGQMRVFSSLPLHSRETMRSQPRWRRRAMRARM